MMHILKNERFSGVMITGRVHDWVKEEQGLKLNLELGVKLEVEVA